MTIPHLIILYVLTLALLFGASRLFGDSRAGKLSRHTLNILTAGLPALASWVMGKIGAEK